MDTQKAKEFAKIVVKSDKISETDALKIIKLLKKRDLSKLSRILKKELEKETVTVTSADTLDHETDSKLKLLFKDKILVKTVDPKIGAGIRAQVYDMIYDLSIKSEIKKLAQIALETI